MERIPVKMIRDDLENLPYFKPPEGFRIRLFKSGDEENWVRIETSVDEFANFDKALEHFKGNKRKTASALGINRTTLYNILARMDPDPRRNGPDG